jgi:hypothetical protein
MFVLFDGLKSSTRNARLNIYKRFAAFRKEPSAEAALQTFIKMDRDQALAELDRFREHLEPKVSPQTVSHWVGMIRTAVVKAREADLTPLNLDEPPVEYASGSLMFVLFDGVSDAWKRELQRFYKAYATDRKASSSEAALQEFIDMERDEALAELDRFETNELKRVSQSTATTRVGMLRTVVVKAREAKLTTLNLDRKKRRSHKPESLAKRPETPQEPPPQPQPPPEAEPRHPKSRHPERDDFCIWQREQGVSFGEIMRKVHERPEWAPLETKVALRQAIKRRCEALGRKVP